MGGKGRAGPGPDQQYWNHLNKVRECRHEANHDVRDVELSRRLRDAVAHASCTGACA